MGKYIDKVYEQLRTQFEKSRNLFPSEDEAAEPTPFRNMKEALKFALGFNTKLINALQEREDQTQMVSQ